MQRKKEFINIKSILESARKKITSMDERTADIAKIVKLERRIQQTRQGNRRHQTRRSRLAYNVDAS